MELDAEREKFLLQSEENDDKIPIWWRFFDNLQNLRKFRKPLFLINFHIYLSFYLRKKDILVSLFEN